MKSSPEMPESQLTWTIAQVLYTSLEARIELLTSPGLQRVASSPINGQWFFADIPVSTKAGKFHGLELAVSHSSGDESVPKRFREWLRHGVATGLSSAPSFVTASAILQPQLFLGKRVPYKYPEALAVASSRASSILARNVDLGGTSASILAAREELAAIYQAFLPNQYEREKGLVFHAQWLESLVRPGAERNLRTREPGAEGRQEPYRIEQLPLQPYGSVAEQICAELERVASGRSDSGGWNYADLRNALTARFAHIQVVRLWGPEYPNALLREAEIVRCLAFATELG